MSCLNKLKIILPSDVAVTENMGTAEKASLILVAEGHMFALRILLVNSIDASCIMDFRSAICQTGGVPMLGDCATLLNQQG